MLAAIARRIAAHRLWLTYNGRSFDIPVLAARCTINRLAPGVGRAPPPRRPPRPRPPPLPRAPRRLHPAPRRDVAAQPPPRRRRARHGGARAATAPGCAGPGRRSSPASSSTTSRTSSAPSSSGRGWPRTSAASASAPPTPPTRTTSPATSSATGSPTPPRPSCAAPSTRASTPGRARPPTAWLSHLQRRGAMEEALELWRRLHVDDPRDLRAARGYAIRLERSGDLRTALEVCATVRETRIELGRWWPRLRGGGEAGEVEWSRREVRLRRRLHS